MKAIIIGGGIAGLAAAKALQLLEWEVSIFEKAAELKPAGAGIVLSANALKALQALSLYDAVTEKGNPIEKINLLDQRGKTLTTTNHALLSKKLNPISEISLHRTALQQALLSQLKNINIHTGRACKSILQTEHGVEVHFDSGEREKADLLLGCDGIHSIVRKAVFPDTEIRYSGYTCWRGITSKTPDSRDSAYLSETWGKGSRFGIVPLKDNSTYWFACLNTPKQGSQEMKELGIPELQKVFRKYHDPVQEVLQLTPPENLLWNDIIDLKPIPSFSKGRVVLLGDAAHASTPNMGQGACQALEDAAVLGSLLQKNDYATAFRKFDQLRVPRTHKIVKDSWQLGRISQWENPLAIGIRNLLIKSMPESVSKKQLDKLFNVEFDKVCNC